MAGHVHGETANGEYFDDSEACSLTFNDRIIEISGHGTEDGLNYIKFHYSNKKSEQHGGRSFENKLSNDYQFKLKRGEYINGVTVYKSARNYYINRLNGTPPIIGLRFHKNNGEISKLFGSNSGHEDKEQFLKHRLGYVRGQAGRHIDAIQFIWYRETKSTATAILPTFASN